MVRRATRFGVLGALATLLLVSLAAAQPQQAPGEGGGFAFGNFDPTQIQQMLDDNSRQTLGATAEEWKVLGPRFNKVQTLTRSINGGAMGMFGMGRGGMFGMGRGGMGMPGGQAGMGDAMTRGLAAIMGEPTDLDEARDKLYAAIDNDSAITEIRAAITAFRDAKEKTRKELAVAQADLKKVCTVLQEATLVAMGLLD